MYLSLTMKKTIILGIFLTIFLLSACYNKSVEIKNEIIRCPNSDYGEPLTKKEIQEKDCECYSAPNSEEIPAWKCNKTTKNICKKFGENLSWEEESNNISCCEGLKNIGKKEYYDNNCEYITHKSIPCICLACGNRICDDYENKCNCPEDCKNIKNENLSLQEKCEKSGGKWDFIICNMPNCEPEYYCNCLIEENEKEENEFFQKDSKFLIKKENICTPCNQNSDCGKNTCSDDSGCVQNSAVCQEGICYTKYYIEMGTNPTINYHCVNNECQPKEPDKKGYILRLNEYYNSEKDLVHIQGEDLTVSAEIKNISSSFQNFEVIFELKRVFGDTTLVTQKANDVIESGETKKIKATISTKDLKFTEGTEKFELYAKVPGIGEIKMDNWIKITQRQHILIKSFEVSEKISKSTGYSAYATFKIKINNPTSESFRAFVDFYVTYSGGPQITKRPQMFVDLKPYETKELTDNWYIDKLDPGFYSVQAVAYVGDYQVTELESFEVIP